MTSLAGDQPTLRVLLVEDDPGDAQRIERLLAESGLHVELRAADRLARGLEELSAEIDVVLLDLSLPDAGGAETVARVHDRAPGLPIVVLAGADDDRLALELAGLGAQDFLSKSRLDGDLLARTIHYAVERKRLEQRLWRSQRLESVGQLAGGIAHDFNNLVTVILANCHFLSDQMLPGDPRQRRIEEIRAAAERSAALTRQLLAFSRRQALHPVALNLNAVISELRPILDRLVGEEVELVANLSPELWTVKADPGQIEQVILNLAVNSRDAMPHGGRLTIETANVELPAPCCDRRERIAPGSHATIAVRDTGVGMDPGTLARLFEPFFTTRQSSGGTGLGMATVYGIVRQSGGRVCVRSRPGHGTRFWVHLPRATYAAQSVAAAPRPERPAGGTETILLVEDQDALRRLTRGMLEDLGYAVLEARDGREGLERQRQHAGPIDLVLSGTALPATEGNELAELLGRLDRRVRLVLMSGYPVGNGENGSRSATTLSKPFTFESLAGAVRLALDREPRG